MSVRVSGLVERVTESQSQYGALYAVVVNGQRYSTGKSTNGVTSGAYVEFSATQKPNGYWDVDKGSMKPIEAPKSAQTAPVASALGQAPATPYADKRQDSIIYQSSRKDALEFISILLDHTMIDFGKAKGADKIAIAEAYLDRFTSHFISEVNAGTPSPSQGNTPKSANVAAATSEEGPDDELLFN